MSADSPIVIVGAGLAGVHAAEAIRAAGCDERVVLVGAESHLPYDRPPLSKQMLAAGTPAEPPLLRPTSHYAERRIELALGCRAARIDRQRRELELTDDRRLKFSKLLLTTGSRLKTLPFLPPGTRGVFYLRELDDALALPAALQAGGRVAVIGAGVIGMEVAAAAAVRGLTVTVVEAAERIMARATAPIIARYLASAHAARGVRFCCGISVQPDPSAFDGHRVRLTDGTQIDADILVVGIGITPITELAQAAGLEIAMHGGIMVDPFGRTTDPGIFAAGEAASHFNDWSGRHEWRENWRHAAAHGAHVGASMVSPGSGYSEICSYWTDQYDISLQTIGAPQGDTDVLRGDMTSKRFIVFHLSNDIVVGASAVGVPRELRLAKALVRGRARVEPVRLSDPHTDLARVAA